MKDMESKELPCKTFTKIGKDMTWPSCNDDVAHIEWKIRHHPSALNRGDLLVAASVISAYIDLVRYSSQKKRNSICKALKSAGGR